MNKSILKSVIAVSILYFSSANAATLYVEKWGSPSGACSAKDPCDQISTALNIATPNSRVIVGPGRYDGGLLIQQTGIKLESTGGPQVTVIDAANIGSGVIGIDIQADRVSIGKIRGKGFTILSEDAEIIRVGTASEVTACGIDSFSFGGDTFFFADATRSPEVRVSGARIEGNNLFQNITTAPNLVGSSCSLDDFNAPTASILSENASLDAVKVVGDSVILTGNNIIGTGITVLNLSETVKRSTIKGNNIKHDFNTLATISGFPFPGSGPFGGIVSYAALDIFGNSSLISDNYIEKLGDSGVTFTNGIDSDGERTRITSNIVENFSVNINTFAAPTVSRNIVINSSFVGISDFASDSSATITDNTVFSSSENVNFSIGISATNSRFIRGNNISGFVNDGSTSLEIDQRVFFPIKLRFTTVSNNNFYDSNNVDFFGSPVGRCGVFIKNVDLPIRMSRNFYGSPTELPQIKESSSSVMTDVATTLGKAWHTCTAGGLVSNTTGKLEITNVTTRPSLRANRIRAIFRTNPF